MLVIRTMLDDGKERIIRAGLQRWLGEKANLNLGAEARAESITFRDL
jgi:hypothetical protein